MANKKIKYQTIGTSSLIDPSNKPDFVTPGGAGTSSTINTVDPFAVVNKQMQQGVYGDFLSSPPPSPKWSHQVGQTITGVDYDSYSKYIDQPFSFITDDPDQLRAQGQSVGEKFKYMLPKLVTRVGTNVAGSTVGLLYGGGSFLSALADNNPETNPNKAFWDNSFQRGLDGINDWMDDKLPHYYTKEEQEYGFFKSAFGPGAANFWMNDFTQGLSFVVGAVLTESLVRGMGQSNYMNKAKSLFSKKGRVPYKENTATITQTAQATQNLSRWDEVRGGMLTLRQLGTGAMYEASVEARHHYDRTLEGLVQMHKEQHNGMSPNTKEMAYLVDLATKSGNAVWAGNVALVGYGNYLLFPKIFGRGYNSSKSIFGQVGEELTSKGTKYINLMTAIGRKEAIARNAWSVLRLPLYEGFVEEGGQKLLDLSGQHAAEDFYLAKKDPTYLSMVDELIASTDDTFSEAYGSAEGQKEIGIGFLLAAIGLPGRKSTTGKDGKTTKKFGMLGGAYSSYNDMKMQDKTVDNLVEILNNGGAVIDNLKANVDMMARAGKYQTIEDVAMLINSPMMKKNGEYNGLFLHIMTKLRVGLEQSLRDDVNEIKTMSVEDFREAFGWEATNDLNDEQLESHKDNVIDKMNKQIDLVKENWNRINGTFGTFGDDQKIMMTHALSISEHFDQREADMIEANEKAGLKSETETEVKTEQIRLERDRNEQISLLDRVKNIWNRLKPSKKEKILALPESVSVKQKRNIRSFTSPSHMEELFLELVTKIQALEAQIQSVENDSNISDVDETTTIKDKNGLDQSLTIPSSKKNQLQRLREELDVLLDRKIYLTKALNEGLDPELSRDEQSLLTEWQKRDPIKYAAEKDNVIKRLKDIRNIRAYRHRMIDMYNQMVQIESMSARENVTWNDKGTLIPRPEVMLMRMTADLENLSSNLTDKELGRVYERYNGKVISFNYVHQGEVTVKELRNFAKSNKLLAEIDKRAAEILQAETNTEIEAYIQALKEKNIPYNQENRTEKYTVFVKPETLQNENDRVLIRMPDFETIKKLRRKDLLEGMMGTNATAKEEYKRLVEELSLEKTSYTAYTLNMLKGATDIEVVDSNKVIENAISGIIETSEEQLKFEIEHTKNSLDKVKSELKDIVNLLSEFQTVNQSPESFSKKDKKGREYFTVNGVNYSLQGVANKIAEYTLSKRKSLPNGEVEIELSVVDNLKTQVETLEIELRSYKDDLNNFYNLESELSKSKTIESFQETVFTFMKEKWVGDQSLINELRKSNVFTDNPLMKSIWENMLQTEEGVDDATRVINNLVQTAQQNKALPEEISQLIDKELESIKREYEIVKTAADKLKTFLNIKKDGTVSLRSKKETLQAYNEIVGEMVRLEKLLGRFSSDNIADELKVAILAANEAFAQRNRDYEKFQRLNQVLVGNLKFIIDTYNALRYGETQEIDSEQNPNTKEGEIIGRESMEAVLSDPKSNVYYYGTPITKHGFAKSASEHSLALKKEKDLRLSKEESPVDWSPKLEKELQFYAAINRFHKFTESLSNSNKDQYRLMFINRNTTPEDITDKVLFYNEKTKGFSYAKNIKKGLGTEQTEDIKIVITDKQGKPVIVKDKEGVDQIMYASVASSDVFIQFKKKGETITAYRYASEDLVPGTVKEIAYQGRAYFTGELTQDAIDTIEKHKIFRQGLLEVSGPRYIKISGTSNGMPIWVGGNIDHRAKASETIVQTEESVKNINLNIAVNSKNNIVEFENRKYNFKAGTAYVTKNGRLIPLHVDNLSQPHQNNIYNLLRLYAVQMVNAMNPNSKVNSKDSSYIHTINEQGDVVYAPEVAGKTIEQLLKSMIYFGKHAKNRAAKEYAIYQEGKYLYFGDQQLDINELANPSSVNQDSHAALRIFLSKLNYQINNATLKDDINARSSSRKNLGSELAKWKKKLNKAMSVKGYKMAEIKSLPKAKQTAFYQALHKWKKNNPKPTASDPEYNEYTEVVINDDLSFDFKNWSNYTEYLLGGTQGRSLLDIPFKLNLHKDKTNKNIDTSLTPQFLSVYVIWNKNATVSTLLTPEDLGKVEIQDTMAPKSNETEIVDTKINEEAAENSPEDLTVATDSGLVIGDVKTITHQAVGENPAWQVDFEVTGINPSTSSITVNVKKGVLLNADNTITELDLPSTEMLKAFIEQNLYLPEESGSKYAITNFEVEDETTGSTTDLNNLQRDSSPQLNITVDPEDSSSSGEKGGQAFNITMPHEEFELMDLSKEYETFKSMVPKNSNGSPIFNVSIVQGLVHGKNYGYFTTTGNILLSTESIKGTIYHETFHGITRRLLSPEQRAELYSEVKSITGKASTYKGEVKNLKSFTEKEADEWLAEEFRQYALLKGEYKVGSRVKKSLIQKIFDFIYKFFNSLSKNQSLFDNIYTGKYSGTIDNYTVYNIKDGAAMNASKIDAAAAKDINEAITSAVFDIALSTGIEFSQFFNFSKTNKSLETFLASIYGRPNLKGKTAYNKVRGDLEALYLNIENKITALSNKQLSEQEELLLQTYLLERTTIYNTAEAIRLDWNSFVKKHVKFLKKYKFDLNNQYLQDEISSLNEDSETGEVITKDIANYRSTNEVDPSSTISPELKLIIATLPKVQWTVGENNTKVFKFLTSKYGLNQLANYGQVLNTLYKNLSNVDTSAEMLAVLDILAEKDATYQVLLNRLGLSKLGGYSSYAGVLDQSLTNEEMKLLMSFLTSFKTTAKEYKILNVDTEQRRSLVNADQDNINAVIKSKWKAKFRQRLNTNFGVKNAEQRLVMDLNKKLSLNTQGKTITKPLGTEKGWLLDKDRSYSETIAILEYLGIEFTDLPVLEEALTSDLSVLNEFESNVNWIFADMAVDIDPKTKKLVYLTTKDMSDLFENTDSFGRIQKLIEYEASTTKQVISLQNRFNNKKRHGVTIKHFTSSFIDYLNSDRSIAADLLTKDNMIGSFWLNKISTGTEIKLVSLLGNSNKENNKDTEISRSNEASILVNHVNSILQGIYPIIRTGNKKSEDAVYVGPPSYKITDNEMSKYLIGILLSEIQTANSIYNNDASQIPSLKDKTNLQWFNHPDFVKTKAIFEPLIKGPRLASEVLLSAIKKDKKVIDLEIKMFLAKKMSETFNTLLEYNILYREKNTIKNIGIDFDILELLKETLSDQQKANAFIKRDSMVEFELLKEDKFSPFLKHIITQLTYMQMQSSIEQSKLFLAHPGLYKELFKRTSMFSSPKRFLESDSNILTWYSDHYPNMASKNPKWSPVVTSIVRDEVIETSNYIDKYARVLGLLGASNSSINNMQQAFTNMEVFDGGGLVHIDFYRRARILANYWTDVEEEAYIKVLEGTASSLDIGILSPIKPQVMAPMQVNNLSLLMGDKFALFPVHPNLHKPLGSENIVMDDIYKEMTEEGIDYIAFPSSRKIGAKTNSKGNFNPLLNENKTHAPLNGDRSAIVEYDLRWFGIQLKPKDKMESSVSRGTQKTTFIPTDIYNNGVVSPKYVEMPLSETMTWEQGINMYHDLHSALIQKEVANLTARLGAIETATGFKSLKNNRTRKLIKNTLIDELSRRDIDTNIIESIEGLFDSDITFINQLYQKNRLETLLYSIMTNAVVKRKMYGNKVMIQSVVGYDTALEATLGLKPLKFYDKATLKNEGESVSSFYLREALSPTTAAEIYAPHSWRGMLEGFDLDNIDPRVLTVTGFRIPTEFLSSIDVFKIKGFLPKAAGNKMIVPAEIVAKTGADFDSDEITIQLPFIEIKDGNPQIVAQVNSIAELREKSPKDYIAAAIEIYKTKGTPEGALEFIKDFNLKTNEEADFEKLDERLRLLKFDELPMFMKQPKQVVENMLLMLETDILLHPLSFEQLMNPVGAFDMQVQAEQIQAERVQNGISEAQNIELFDMLSLKGLTKASNQMWSTLLGTGIVATGSTNLIKSQRGGMFLETGSTYINILKNKMPFKLYFEGLSELNKIPFGNVTDIKGEKISSSLRKYITAYVDGEKNPFAMYINAGIDGAGLHVFLNKAGVPLSTVIDFMSQPIILEYINLKHQFQGDHSVQSKKSFPKAHKTDIEIINFLTNKYGRGIGEYMPLRSESLQEMRSIPIQSMSNTQKQLQLQILDNFVMYKGPAETLRKIQTVTSQDTSKLKNGHEIIYSQAIERIIQKDGYFKNIVGLTGVTSKDRASLSLPPVVLQQPPLLNKLKNLFNNSGNLLENLDFKYSKNKDGARPIEMFLVNLAETLTEQRKSKAEVLRYLEKFDNHLTSFLFQTAAINQYFPLSLYEKYGEVKLNTLIEKLFQGPESLPRRIIEAKKKYRTNTLLEELVPELQEFTDNKNFDYYIDKMQLASSRYDTDDLSGFGRDTQVLFEQDPELVLDLFLYSFLKSGTSFSSKAFFQALPGSLLLPVTKQVFENSEMKLRYNQLNLNDIYEDFLDNQWDSFDITPVKFTANWNGKKQWIRNKYYGPRTLVKSKRGSKQAGLFTRDTYHNYFYKFSEVQQVKKGKKTFEMYIYELHQPKGVKNEIIVAGRPAVLNSNKTPKAASNLKLSLKESETLFKNNRTQIKRGYKLIDGMYRLKDGKIVALRQIKSNKKINSYELIIQRDAVREAPIQEVTTAEEAAQSIDLTALKDKFKSEQKKCKE